MPNETQSSSPMPSVLRPATPNNPPSHQKSKQGAILGQGENTALTSPFIPPTGSVKPAPPPVKSKPTAFQVPKICPLCRTHHTGACATKQSTPPSSDAGKPATAQEILDKYKSGYAATDRVLPFTLMKDVTNDSLSFSEKKASQKHLDKVSNKKFALRHYTKSVDGPPTYNTINPNFELVNTGVKTLNRTQGSNTNEDDWNRLGNTAFTFFLLAIDGKVSERRFLASMTHYAEFDLEDPALLSSLGLDTAEFFASPDLLHEKNLSAVKAVKGPLSELKSLMIASSELQPIQLGIMHAAPLLEVIDTKFQGSLEIKIPGSVPVPRWIPV
ncbi:MULTISPECIES: hypothetical protein [Pseudomonas]|jgi:hypothetical protein|uniref:hypothetical protein n=1 Tax=Pseudomonas TaxID=286 RepID=UPI0012DD82E2|nr:MULTISPECIES: hypothetical protein [Pseudomonas]MBF6043221.1 hypothetical protein [Pseudomonas mucoides]